MRLLETLTKMMALTLTVLGFRNGDCAEFPQMLIFYLNSVENANVNVFMDLLFLAMGMSCQKKTLSPNIIIENFNTGCCCFDEQNNFFKWALRNDLLSEWKCIQQYEIMERNVMFPKCTKAG